jgi:GTP-binding protein
MGTGSGAGIGVAVVAVVGRPNVGKSSLVNRVLGRREAIVESQPGVTRDRSHFVAEWAGREFEIVDTGGLEPGTGGLDERVAEQAQIAIETADVIVLVVDAVAGVTEDDLTVARTLRRSDKPVVVAANKVDDPHDEPLAAAFFRLGLGEPHAVSALHGRGSGDFLEALVKVLPGSLDGGVDSWASIAIVGRPNVGKSSILNSLMQEDRSLVDPVPGTTRGPVDSFFDLADGRRVRVVDTAGMRRQVRIEDPIEYFSLLRSRRTLSRVDVALLIVDASEGVTAHDQHLAREILDQGLGCVVALNKWDAVVTDSVDRRRLEDEMSRKLRFLPWAPVLRTSAITRRGVDRIWPLLEVAVESRRRRLPTAIVNKVIRGAQEARPHPRLRGRQVRLLYAAQAEISPPMFVVFANERVEKSYIRYLERRIREAEAFEGSPIVVTVRVKSRRQMQG